MENKIYIVPDVHCRNFYKPILRIQDEPVIFLGDYMDPYSWEGFTDEDGIANLEEIFEYAKNNKNVTLLVGNHDESHIWSYMNFERTSYKFYSELHRLYRDNIDLLHPCKLMNDTLFTHAGISKYWLEKQQTDTFKLNESNIVSFIENEWYKELEHERANGFRDCYLNSRIFDIGYIRGGDSAFGGPFWNDIRDYKDPNWKLYQVFSHTQLDKDGSFIKLGQGIMCDSRKIFEYDLDKHEIKLSKLNLEK